MVREASAPGRAKIRLAHVPTPLERHARLGAALGCDLWVKRDDATGGAEAGNKVRKLEYLAADAAASGADTLITCGGVQSNHARATALVAARLGMRSLLFLRTSDGRAPVAGNVLLDRLAGAELRLITPDEYRRRAEIMQGAADELGAGGRRAYVIPEGGSNGLGALGYVDAMAEVRRQLDGEGGGDASVPLRGFPTADEERAGPASRVPCAFDVVVHACGSGGTAAGVALGAAAHGVAREARAMAVCDDEAYFTRVIGGIVDECRALEPSLGAPARWIVDARAKGPAYAVSSAEQRVRMVEATRLSGLVFDPVYTGKALCGLWQACDAGDLRGARVLFLHTGGLPGLLAQADAFAAELG